MNMSALLITVAIAVLVPLAWASLIELCTVLVGPKALREFHRRKATERVHILRGLPKWQVILLEGVLRWGLYMVAVFTIVDYVRSRYEPGYHFDLGMIPAYFIIFVACGVGYGFSAWNRLWDGKFDRPTGKIGSSAQT